MNANFSDVSWVTNAQYGFSKRTTSISLYGGASTETMSYNVNGQGDDGAAVPDGEEQCGGRVPAGDLFLGHEPL